jgi:hypothetical protein
MQSVSSYEKHIIMNNKLTLQAIALFVGLLTIPCPATPNQDQTGDRKGAAAEHKPTSDEAKAAAAMWLDGLDKKGLVLSEKIKGRGFMVAYSPSGLGRVTKFTLEQSDWWVSLVFRGELTPETPIETLKNNLLYVTLDRLPTPGLDLPGWNIHPQTPISSFKEGVEILAYRDGKIKLRVRTKFFALYGHDPSIIVPGDAPAPPDSCFEIRNEFPLDLRLEAPFEFN